VIDELRRTPGVGDASLFGASDYSRIWLRPDKLAQYNLTTGDVATAIREQNAQFAAGRFGEEPQKNAATFTYSVTTQGRFADPVNSRRSSSVPTNSAARFVSRMSPVWRLAR
jgi:multidrug efflux pump